jgi:hypothetical protein
MRVIKLRPERGCVENQPQHPASSTACKLAIISNDEVEWREQELESGQVTAISHEEFVRRVQRACRR